MSIIAAASQASIASAVISALAALIGVILGQIIAWLERRREEQHRRRAELAATIAPPLAMILEAIEQIDRGARSGTAWQTQPAWTRLRTDDWPPIRTRLLLQSAQEPEVSREFDVLTLSLDPPRHGPRVLVSRAAERRRLDAAAVGGVR
jgi:hypothetical protein